MQTELPYFQPTSAAAPQPFTPIDTYSQDPTFTDCTAASCKKSWDLRILKSTNIFIYSAGSYSLFGENYDQGSVAQENCQKSLVQASSDAEVLWRIKTSQRAQRKLLTGRGMLIPTQPIIQFLLGPDIITILNRISGAHFLQKEYGQTIFSPPTRFPLLYPLV